MIYSGCGPLLRSFLRLWRFLPRSRFWRPEAVTLVGMRFFLNASARRSRSANFSTASSRFRHWLRDSCVSMRSTPPLSTRDARPFRILAFSSPLNEGDPLISNIRVTRDETLFTFWPPGPPLLLKRKLNSDRGIRTRELITIPCSSGLVFTDVLRTIDRYFQQTLS